jgi:TPR repeat protein
MYSKFAADQGYPGAQFNYGFSLEHGVGVSRSYIKAVRYLKLAAGQGHANAQSSYGSCLEKGNSISMDYEEAV